MNIDLTSELFKSELKKTKDFAKKIYSKMKLFPNPDKETNERIYIGLTRNALIYGKRYCPCFIVTKMESSQNRICPCEPAITKEIPETGSCHCGIFCTSEYINNDNLNLKTSNNSKLKIASAQDILNKPEITNEELIYLLKSRSKKEIDFILVDVREKSEYDSHRIIGVNFLVPTSDFYNNLNLLENKKESNIILQCHSGGRSYQAQQLMKNLGYKNVINLTGGISCFNGGTIKNHK